MAGTAPHDMLRELGLSKYAAQTLVGLQKVGEGAASDIAAVTDVPRSQVYGAVEELETLGLVNTHSGSPKTFTAVRPEAVGDILQARIERQTADAVADLQAVYHDAIDYNDEEEAVWRAQGLDSATQQSITAIKDAENRVQYYCSANDQLPPDLQATLIAQASRGTKITLYAPEEAITELPTDTLREPQVTVTPLSELQQTLPDCTRLLSADGTTALIGIPPRNASSAEICFWSANTQIGSVLATAVEALLTQE